MPATVSLARRLATGLVAVQLLAGAVSATALATAAPAAATEAHGAWEAFQTKVDGKVLFGAITRMNKGGTAAFLVKEDKSLSLYMTDDSWTLREGDTLPVRLTIDGKVLTGTAIVRGRHLIEIPNVYRDVLTQFVAGAQATIDVNRGDLVWTLDLHGFTASMEDAVRLVRDGGGDDSGGDRGKDRGIDPAPDRRTGTDIGSDRPGSSI